MFWLRSLNQEKGITESYFEQISKQGFVKVRVDGVILDLQPGMKVDRYKTHDIEIVIDRLSIDTKESTKKRLSESIETAMDQGKNVLMVLETGEKKARYFSRDLMCPSSGISYPIPEPNTFSFNSPKGMCPSCQGLGVTHKVNIK